MHTWLTTGTLHDPHSEFFIRQSNDQDGDEREIDWRNGWSINYAQVPGYITKAMAKKILVSGKSLCFIRNVCGDVSFQLSDFPVLSQVKFGDSMGLAKAVDRAYKTTSKHLLGLFFDRYNFAGHLSALKRYLLCGQGDFIQSLMDSLGYVVNEIKWSKINDKKEKKKRGEKNEKKRDGVILNHFISDISYLLVSTKF